MSTPAGHKPPVKCYDIINSKTANVYVKYLSKRVVLANDNNKPLDFLTVSVENPNELPSAIEAHLQTLIEAVKTGELDVELQQMFDEKRAKEAAAKR